MRISKHCRDAASRLGVKLFEHSFKTALKGALHGAVGALGLLLGTTACAEDLMEIFQQALQNDPQYLSAGAANRARQEVKPQARSLLLPNLQATASAAKNHQDVRKSSTLGATGTDSFSSNRWGLSLSQPIFRLDRFIGLGQADAQVSQSDAEYAFALQDVILRSAERYFGVLRTIDALEFARAEKEANDQQLNQARQRFEVGLIAITDVEEAQAGFDLSVASEIAAENQLDNAREALREITGTYYRNLRPLSGDIPLVTPEPNDIDQWTETALRQNLQLEAVRYQAEVAEKEIKRARAGHAPTVDLVGTHERTDSGGFFGSREIWDSSVGVEVALPIFEGGIVLSQTREARHLYQQALDDLEGQRRSTQRQTRDAFLGVLSDISRVKALAQALESTETALEAIEAGFRVGTRTSVDVLGAQRELFRAKRDYAGSRYDYILNLLTLKQAAGTLSEEDLRQVSSWLK